MSAIFYDQLEPYMSLTLAKATAVPAADRLTRCLADMELICAQENGGKPTTSEFKLQEEVNRGGVRMRALFYKRAVQAAWTKDKEMLDIEHHLALVVARKDYVALHLTDSKLKGPLRTALFENPSELPLGWLTPVSRGIMSAAFLTDGQARTLWLSGIHRRSATKADAKILAGQDLDYSLDPFDDQSFYWSAARSRSATLNITVGVSPKSSRVWIGKARSAAGFGQAAALLLDTVASAKDGDEPFRFLATPLLSLKAGEVHDAYDISILPPDMLDDAAEDAEQVNGDAALILETNLIVAGANGTNLDIMIERNAVSLGTLKLEAQIAANGTVKLKSTALTPAGVDDAAFDRLAALLGKGAGVNIRFDTGHTVSDRQVYSTRMQRVPFKSYEPRDFGTFAIKKEKPDDLANIGKNNDKSLFSWVFENFPGWLACDDGANEKADFINLDMSGQIPVLSLIHVKGAKSASANRRLSVSAYEVVTGQAIKNLQWLDKQELAKGLEEAARASNYWWKDKVTVDRDELVAEIAGLGDNFIRRVIIVQPHVTKGAYDNATAAKNGVNRLRLDQLNTLLASAWRACNGLGVEFKVIWSD